MRRGSPLGTGAVRLAALCLSAWTLGCAGRRPAPPEESSLAILGASVVDPDSEAPPWRASVLVQGDRIVAAGEQVTTRRGTRVIDATGKFLVPGLWDLHAHLNALTEIGAAPEHFVGHGVLALRDCGGFLQPLLALRRETAAGRRTGPQLFLAGPTLNGESFAPFQRVVRDEAEARAAVRELAAAGVDFVKTHRATSREAFFALADEARKHNLDLVGHVPLAVSWVEAAEAGMRSIEHAQTMPENEMKDAQAPAATIEEAFQRLDGERGDAIFAALARTGAVFDPTLVAYEESIDRRPELAARRREAYVHLKAYVGRAHRAGVTLVAGTDVLEKHGEMLLRELERLVEVGLTPRQALAAGTSNCARLLRRPDLGKIAPRATASFLLLDADPTLDVRNLRRLSGVVLRGRYLDAAELRRLRAEGGEPRPLP